MASDPTAALVHLVAVHGPHTFQAKPWRRTYMVAGGTRNEAVDRVLDHLERPDNCTAELLPDRLSEDEVRSMNVRPGEIRELSRVER